MEKQGFCFHSEGDTIFIALLWSYEMNVFLHKDVQGVEIVSGILCVGRVVLFLPEHCPMSFAYLLGGPSQQCAPEQRHRCLLVPGTCEQASSGVVTEHSVQPRLTACSMWKEAALSERANGEKHSINEHLSATKENKEQSNWTWGVPLQLQLLLEIKTKQKGCSRNM